ncbi:MAG: pyruvate kinase [Thermoplasmata archaeon]
MRRTKILATLGPVSSSLTEVRALVRAGTNAVRLNCSHGSDEEHRAILRTAHAAFRREKIEGAVLVDVQGPKIRIGGLEPNPLTLRTGQSWSLYDRPRIGGASGAYAQVPQLSRAARRGDPLLLGDGNVELRVLRVESHRVITTVVHGGSVGSHAGLFLPAARLATSVLEAKDRHDLDVVLAEGIDFLGLSFVRDVADVRLARSELNRRPRGSEVGIIAKIERAEALEHIDEILDAADGVMVARGDLGIEVPLERLAIEQKSILRRAKLHGKLGIVATEMLLSMVHSPRPTRAEATDVANAVLDGADAVMLSEESAVGEYPVESIEWLDRICRAAEPELVRAGRPGEPGEIATPMRLEDSVARGAVALASQLNARAIVTPTHSGRTATWVARLRPSSRIVALSARASTRRHLALVWGVEARAVPARGDLLALTEWSRRALRSTPSGSGPIVLTAGYPVEGRPTNLLMVVDPGPANRERDPR